MYKPILENSEIQELLRKTGDLDGVDLTKVSEELNSLLEKLVRIDAEITRLEQLEMVSEAEIQKVRRDLSDVMMSVGNLKTSDSLEQSEVIAEPDKNTSNNRICVEISVEVSPFTITKDYSAVDKKLREESKKAIAYLDSL